MLVFSWKAAVLIFIAIQKHTAQKWQWQNMILIEIVVLEREKNNKKSQLKREKRKIWLDLFQEETQTWNCIVGWKSYTNERSSDILPPDASVGWKWATE